MKKIFYDSQEAAQIKTITGWVSSCNRFWGGDEHMARWDGCTHQYCKCGNEVERSRIICSTCSSKLQDEKYMAMPFKCWDGKGLLVIYGDDTYFNDEDEVLEYCEEHEISPDALQLVICEPQYAWEIDTDYFSDILPEDKTLDDCYPELAEAIERVNELIRKKETPLSWAAGKFRTKLNTEELS
jgi:hypothetical protein